MNAARHQEKIALAGEGDYDPSVAEGECCDGLGGMPPLAPRDSLRRGSERGREGSMSAVLKRVVIATVLIVVCGVIFVLTKRYGVWVISGIAVVLFLLGLLRRDEAKGGGDDVPEERDTGSGAGKRENR